MKKRLRTEFLFVLITILLVSCNNKAADIENDSEEPAEKTEEPGFSEIKYQANQLHGLWMGNDYLNAVEKDKSIYRHRKYSTRFFGFSLEENNLLTNNPVLYGFTDHEGGYDIFLEYDKEKQAFISRDAIEKFEIKLNNGIFEMYFPEYKRTEKYRKVKPDIESALRELLIAGKYKSPKHNETIILRADGKVTNFLDFEYYELIFDFTEAIEYDAIVFYSNKNGGNWSQGRVYTFEIIRGDIHMRHVETNWETHDHIISDEIIVLTKNSD